MEFSILIPTEVYFFNPLSYWKDWVKSQVAIWSFSLNPITALTLLLSVTLNWKYQHSKELTNFIFIKSFKNKENISKNLVYRNNKNSESVTSSTRGTINGKAPSDFSLGLVRYTTSWSSAVLGFFLPDRLPSFTYFRDCHDIQIIRQWLSGGGGHLCCCRSNRLSGCRSIRLSACRSIRLRVCSSGQKFSS